MNILKRIFSIIFLILFFPPLAFTSQDSTPALPAAAVVNPDYKFKVVPDGAKVPHDFLIENVGDAPLIISDVQTSCGCTTVSYSKEIFQGEKGRISIQADTKGYGGQTFSTNIIVHTNDPEHSQISLNISGPVDKFAEIEPENVRLSGPANKKIEAAVKIIPAVNYPFNIIKATPGNGKHIRIFLEKKDAGYVLHIENILKNKGRYFDTITLKTDNPANPEIRIRVFGMIS